MSDLIKCLIVPATALVTVQLLQVVGVLREFGCS